MRDFSECVIVIVIVIGSRHRVYRVDTGDNASGNREGISQSTASQETLRDRKLRTAKIPECFFGIVMKRTSSG